MRRGIGVGYVRETDTVKTQMNELGSRITAERVSDIADQLEALEKQLRILSQKHKQAIEQDPVVRARFRQLADSLGLDLLSSQKNVFSGALGLGDFYYRLAGKVVECCMNERKFCGSYVPLRRIVQQVEKNFDGLISNKSDSKRGATRISEDDVLTALKKLRVFGSGYSAVTLGGAQYIQTTVDGTKGTDVTQLLNHIIGIQQRASQHSVVSSPQAESPIDASPSLRFGAAYVLGVAQRENIPAHKALLTQAVSFTLFDIQEQLVWEDHRASAALSRLVQDGTLWVDYPARDPLVAPSAKVVVPLTAIEISSKKLGGSSKKSSELDGGAVYWFFPQ